MKLNIIIPSKESSNLIPCLRSLRLNQPDLNPRDIIVIDDGLNWAKIAAEPDADWLNQVNVQIGTSPFIFARNVNKGLRIARAEGNHALVLNDDAILNTYSGVKILYHHLKDNPAYGILSPAVDSAGNRNQNNHGVTGTVRPESRMLCFMAVLIRNELLSQHNVGLMDERYVDYGMDDDDYCAEALKRGWRLGVVDDVSVDHTTLVSTYRGQGKGGDFSKNMTRYIEKWGVDNWGRPRETSQFAHLFPPQ